MNGRGTFLTVLRWWLCGWLVAGPGTHPLLAATFHVNAATGDDGRTAAEAASSLTPWRSLTRALSEPGLSPGDLIQVAPGLHDGLVEVFPLELVSGVSILGAGEDLTHLQTDARAVFTAPPLLAGAQVHDLSLSASPEGAAGFALDLADASLELLLQGLSLDGSLEDGIAVAHTSGPGLLSLTVENSTFSTAGDGIDLSASSASSHAVQLLLDHNTFRPADRGLHLVQSYLYGDANLTVHAVDNQFLASADGIYGYAYAGFGNYTADLLLSGNTFSGHSSDAVAFSVSSMSFNTIGYSVQILHNRFDEIGGRAVDLDTFYLAFGTLEVDHLLEGNTLTNVSGTGISLSYTSLFAMDEIRLDLRILGNTQAGGGDTGTMLDLSSVYSSRLDADLLLAGNTLSDLGGSGLDLSISSLNYNDVLRLNAALFNNTISRSQSDAIQAGISGLSSNTSADLLLRATGNTIHDSSADGIKTDLRTLYGPDLNLEVTLSGNTIRDSGGTGLGFLLSSQSALGSPLILVEDNHVQRSGGDGIQLTLADFVGPSVRVSGNALRDNGVAGLALSGNPSGLEPVVGVPFDLGDGPLNSPGLNVFGGAQPLALSSELPSQPGEVLPARSNGWEIDGELSTDASSIDALIYDDEEESGLLPVDFSAPLAAAPGVAVSLSLESSLILDVGATGAGPGDVLRFSATLSNEGEVGCASAHFSAPIPVGSTLVEESVLLSQGVALSTPEDGLSAALEWLPAGETLTLSWDLEVDASGTCAPLSVQGVLECVPAGSIPSDDPAAGGSGDPTVVDLLHSVYYPDGDGDGDGSPEDGITRCEPEAPAGYVASSSDCDDTDSSRYPGAPEFCDGVDNNCNGEIDEGDGVTFYVDRDRDGYGDPNSTVVTCEPAPGLVLNDDDCYDYRDDVYPGATEVCDEADNDCDGTIDEGVTSTYYADADGDGDGNPGVSTIACRPPTAYVVQGSDCNDADSSVYSGAVEACDGVDNDCDGAIDESGDTLVYSDIDLDGYGDPGAPLSVCGTPPPGTSPNALDCNDRNPTTYPGAEEACDGVDNDCDRLTDEDVSQLYFLDSDGDGYGSPETWVLACSTPDGYVSSPLDCNDSNPEISPAREELCDGVDNNCDGRTDELEVCTAESSPSPTPGPDVEGGGCTCRSGAPASPSPGAMLLMGLLGMAARRRRIRRLPTARVG